MASLSRRSELLLPPRAATPRSTAAQSSSSLSSNTTLSNPYVAFGTPPAPTPASGPIPTIRLTTATPAQSSTSGSPLAPRQSPRAKLVPKRSKLSLLVSKKEKGQDLSDIVRRVGAPSDTSRSFDIYVDPADDPEIGEIVVVQRKKSRVALGDIGWSLNIDAAAQEVAQKVKEPPKEKPKENKENVEEKSNWWTRTMGRGRKDSKEKDKDKDAAKRGRSKSPGPFRSLSGSLAPQPQPALGRPATQRTHSLDAGLLLAIPTAAATAPIPSVMLTPTEQAHYPDPFAANPLFPTGVPPPSRPPTPSGMPEPVRGRSATLSLGSSAYLAPPMAPDAPLAADKNGSLAIRAMRSVKSLARLGSWAQLRGGDDKENPKQDTKKERDFKKAKRSSKTGSVSSAMALDARRSSKQSTGAESILSTASGGSADPRRASSGSSVRWDPSVVENRRASSSTKRSSLDSTKTLDSARTERRKPSSKRDTTSNPDARRRPALPVWSVGEPAMVTTPSASAMSLPPPTPPSLTKAQSELQMAVMYAKSFSESPTFIESPAVNWSTEPQPPTPPIMEVDEDPLVQETPAKKNRPRPMSEQLLGERQRAALMDDDPLALLNAATSDLASLINRLDLRTPESTPHTTRTRYEGDDLTEPLPSVRGSPVRRAATMGLSSVPTSVPGTPRSPEQPQSPQSGRGHQISITSLRPYAQSRTPSKRHSGIATTMTVQPSAHPLIGRPILPLPMSPSQLKKDALATRESLPKLRTVGSLPKSPVSPTMDSAQNTLRGSLKRRSTQMLAAIFSTPELPPRSESPEPPLLPLSPPPPRPAISPRTKTLRPSRTLARKDVLVAPTSSSSILSNNVNNVLSTTAKNVSSRTLSTNDGTNTTPPTTTTTKMATPSPIASHDNTSPKLPPGSTFGASRPSKTSRTPPSAGPDTPTPPPTRSCGHVRKSSSLIALPSPASPSARRHSRKPSGQINKDQRRNLGMKGTLGAGSVGDVPLDDDASDVPDELQTIISSAENTIAFPSPGPEHDELVSVLSRPLIAPPTPPSPGPPPAMPPPTPAVTPAGTLSLPIPSRISIPVFKPLTADEAYQAPGPSPVESTEDTKKSFDFTGELASLSSGQADSSFVEQLEAAFQTPAKMTGLKFDVSFVPEVPPIPATLRSQAKEQRLEPQMEEHLDEIDSTTKTDCGMSSEGDYDGEDDCIQITPQLSRPSDGELNKNFKFGNTSPPKVEKALSDKISVDHNLTLADIIPPPAHVEHVRKASVADSSDDSIVKSIMVHAQPLPHSFEKAVRERLSSIAESESASKRRERQNTYQALVRGRHGHSPSEVSFTGLSTFGDIRNKWEFGMSAGAQRSAGPPPSSRRRPHARQISEISIATVSDYGVVLNGGKADPFNFGPVNMMAPDEISVAMDDTFDFRRAHVRNPSVDSDRSSFYFRSAPVWRAHHRRQSSVWSNAEMPSFPPPSTYQRFGHKRSDSTSSANSIALAYGNLGANGGRAVWAKHQHEPSRDSIMSDFSMVRLGRPGVSDKMFESAGFPLDSIAASPPESVASDAESEPRPPSIKPSFETRRTSISDSMFDETERRSSVSSTSDSIFGFGEPDVGFQGNLFGPGHLRPFSVLSNSVSSNGMKEDETMITMLGGGHVRRASLSSMVDSSPLGIRNRRMHHDDDSGYEVQPISSPVTSPERSRIVEKPSYKFGADRMLRAQNGTLSRESLELSCLSADGEDVTSADISVVFTRPMPAARSRPTTLLVPTISGNDTPPLSPSTGSSSGSSNDSQSSIDIERLKMVMEQSVNSSASLDVPGARLRPRGQGHRRRVSQYAQYSRSNSMIETIQEETTSPTSARAEHSFMFPPPQVGNDGVVVVDQDVDASDWDEDSWLQALRRYYELRTEANEEVEISRKTWLDTPWSVHALQSFQPPAHPAGMKALLEHSQKTYLPLPFELRQRRVSLRSRASPYGRTYTLSVSPKSMHPGNASNASILQELSTNTIPPPANKPKRRPADAPTPAPALAAVNPLSPFHFDFLHEPPAPEHAPEPVLAPRQRVPSATRRSALGWSKRKETPKEVKSSNKENAPPSGVVLMSPTESLRLSRPRPKGRVSSGQTPAVAARIKV